MFFMELMTQVKRVRDDGKGGSAKKEDRPQRALKKPEDQPIVSPTGEADVLTDAKSDSIGGLLDQIDALVIKKKYSAAMQLLYPLLEGVVDKLRTCDAKHGPQALKEHDRAYAQAASLTKNTYIWFLGCLGKGKETQRQKLLPLLKSYAKNTEDYRLDDVVEAFLAGKQDLSSLEINTQHSITKSDSAFDIYLTLQEGKQTATVAACATKKAIKNKFDAKKEYLNAIGFRQPQAQPGKPAQPVWTKTYDRGVTCTLQVLALKERQDHLELRLTYKTTPALNHQTLVNSLRDGARVLNTLAGTRTDNYWGTQ